MNIRTDGRLVTVDLTPYEVYLLAAYTEAQLYRGKEKRQTAEEIELEKMLRALKAGAALVSP